MHENALTDDEKHCYFNLSYQGGHIVEFAVKESAGLPPYMQENTFFDRSTLLRINYYLEVAYKQCERTVELVDRSLDGDIAILEEFTQSHLSGP